MADASKGGQSDPWRVAIALAFRALGMARCSSVYPSERQNVFDNEDICDALSCVWPVMREKLGVMLSSSAEFPVRFCKDEAAVQLRKVCSRVASKGASVVPASSTGKKRRRQRWAFSDFAQREVLGVVEDFEGVARSLATTIDMNRGAKRARPVASFSGAAGTHLDFSSAVGEKAGAPDSEISRSLVPSGVSVATRPVAVTCSVSDAEPETESEVLPVLSIFTGKNAPSHVPKTMPSVRRDVDDAEGGLRPQYCYQLRKLPPHCRPRFVPPQQRHNLDGSRYELGEGYFYHHLYLHETDGQYHLVRRPLQVSGLTSVRRKPVPAIYKYVLQIDRSPGLARLADCMDSFYVSDEYTEFLRVRWLGRVRVLDAALDDAVYEFFKMCCELDPSRESFEKVEHLLDALAFCNPQLRPVSSNLPQSTAALQGWRGLLDLPRIIKEDTEEFAAA